MKGRDRNRKVAHVVAALAALAAAVAVGTAVAAPPLKNAERTCTKLGGGFSSDATSYTCAGPAPATSGSFMDSAERQCLNSFKGSSFSRFLQDPVTGNWKYICTL